MSASMWWDGYTLHGTINGEKYAARDLGILSMIPSREDISFTEKQVRKSLATGDDKFEANIVGFPGTSIRDYLLNLHNIVRIKYELDRQVITINFDDCQIAFAVEHWKVKRSQS